MNPYILTNVIFKEILEKKKKSSQCNDVHNRIEKKNDDHIQTKSRE